MFKDATYLSPASSWVCAKTGFTFISLARSFDYEEVKDSWAPAHSLGRSRGLDSFLPVSTSPGEFGLQRTLRLYLVAS